MPEKWTKKKINNKKKGSGSFVPFPFPPRLLLSFYYSFFNVPTSAGQSFSSILLTLNLSAPHNVRRSVGRSVDASLPLSLSLSVSLVVPWPVSSKLFEVNTDHSIFIPALFFKFLTFFLFLSKTWMPIHDWLPCARDRIKSMGSFDMVVGVGMSLDLK